MNSIRNGGNQSNLELTRTQYETNINKGGNTPLNLTS